MYLTYRLTLFLLNEIIKTTEDLQKIQELETSADNNNSIEIIFRYNLIKKPHKK